MTEGHPRHRIPAHPAPRAPLQLHLFKVLTLCCSCFRLKKGDGGWTRRVVRPDDYPGTGFSHGLCPGCYRRLYPAAYKHRRRI